MNPTTLIGPKGYPPHGGAMFNCTDYKTEDGKFWIMVIGMDVTPAKSGFLFVNELPSEIIFGSRDNQYSVKMKSNPSQTI